MSKQDLRIDTPDGSARAGLFRPDAANDEALPGVLLFMDAIGARPELDAMAQRLADAGYVVLLPDLFYRAGDYEPLDAQTAFSDEAVRAKIAQMAFSLPAEKTMQDTARFLDVLAQNAAGPFGIVGYCMGGTRALAAAAVYPDRFAAVATFHGGNLATEKPDSPHLGAAQISARVYVGAAGVDQSFPPEQSTRLADAFRTAGKDFVLENYVGCNHGWTIADTPAYNRDGSERHWRRMTTLFAETLQASAAA